MVVEVGMDGQVTALGDLVVAAPLEIGVGDQPPDAADVLQNLDERPRVEGIEQVPRERLQQVRA